LVPVLGRQRLGLLTDGGLQLGQVVLVVRLFFLLFGVVRLHALHHVGLALDAAAAPGDVGRLAAGGARAGLVGFVLQARVVVDGRALALAGGADPAVALLHHVRQLVAEQLLARGGARAV